MEQEFNAQDGMTPSELASSRDPLVYFRPSADRQAMIAVCRTAFRPLRDDLKRTIAPCRFLSIALTELESASQWAVKALVFTDPQAVEVDIDFAAAS